MPRTDGNAVVETSGEEEEDVKILGLIQRSVQLAHLDAIRDCVKEGNVNEAVSHIRFLNLITELRSPSIGCFSGKGGIWGLLACQERKVVDDLWCSSCIKLQTSQPDDNNQIPPPLECFQRYVVELELDSDFDRTLSLTNAVISCTRDMYHYARVS
ncbi:uncharacterized protein LOC112091015 [Morus notabilis]|uniref:uncharacterized protein LOC112091015 n=1 Tax=Morus notabilis TaxID=981085 RepID=UPI000CED34D2|nr:uncharacterized protein LOC112091015 [Morus notabilis]